MQNNNFNPPPFWARGLNKKSKTIILAIVAILLIVGVFVLLTREIKEVPPETTERIVQKQIETKQNEPELVNAVSLLALMQKKYDGRDLALGKVLEDNSSYTRYYITYKSGELTISGIMNVPKITPAPNGFPVLILNHGYIDTSVYTNGRGLRREQDYLAKQGFVVIHPDYRNHAESSKDLDSEINLRLGYTEDVINLIYAIKSSKLTFLNINNIGMLGHSMGGGVAINTLVVKPDLVKAFVLYAPVSSDAKDNFERWMKTRNDVYNKIITKYGSFQDSPEFWKNISPVNFFDQVKSPVLIFHGTSDDSVPYEWSKTLENKLVEQGKTVRLITYTPEEHEFGPKWNDFMKQTTEFFNQNLTR